MKYHQIIAACGLALLLVLCAFALGGCDLFVKDTPRLVIRNESSGDITTVEFWKETPEAKEISAKAGESLLKQFTDPDNFITHLSNSIKALKEYTEVADKITRTTAPLIDDSTVIPAGGSRSWELETDESFVARVNGKVHSVSTDRGSMDTVYVFNGENLTKER
jgi:hypothetical protein